MSEKHAADGARTKEKLLNAIASGWLKPREVADQLGVSRVTVFRWCKEARIDYKNARTLFVARLFERAMSEAAAGGSVKQIARRVAAAATREFIEQGNRPFKAAPSVQSQPQQADPQLNPMKRRVLSRLRAGKMTIRAAATMAQVPISGIVGWMRIDGLPVPEEYNQPRRKPRADP